MLTDNVKNRAENEITPIINDLGYEVVEVTYKKIENVNTLTFFIYKKGGISLDDCELVSKAIDEPLDKLDITEGESYSLNISSPGLDRPIVSDKDYERNIGEEVEARFKNLVDKKNKTVGILKAYSAEIVTLTVKGIDRDYARSNIKSLQIHIKF